ncbi:NANOG neighbor homeobox [Myotis davidii]|uniref:NANOG neighbor homeobox n=1 Tax=Myotis davidii TaxID=225400 RepID=L5LUG8_MYODS|nr:NANOG neighbor homeobox [Myotis davidii]
MRLTWESNLGPLSLQADTLSTEPNQLATEATTSKTFHPHFTTMDSSLLSPIVKNLAIQKQPVMPCDTNPEQSNRNHSKDERRKNTKWREGEGEMEEEMEKDGKKKLEEEQEEEKKEEKMECEEEYPEKRLVSKPLMDTLWATFKLNKCPTKGHSLSLAFEFNMTEKQVNQWFFKKRKKFKQEMYKQKYKRKLKR